MKRAQALEYTLRVQFYYVDTITAVIIAGVYILTTTRIEL